MAAEQRELIAKVNRINPLVKVLGGTSGLMMLVVAGWAVYIGLKRGTAISANRSSGAVPAIGNLQRCSVRVRAALGICSVCVLRRGEEFGWKRMHRLRRVWNARFIDGSEVRTTVTASAHCTEPRHDNFTPSSKAYRKRLRPSGLRGCQNARDRL
jgi:hypothetical protein